MAEELGLESLFGVKDKVKGGRGRGMGWWSVTGLGLCGVGWSEWDWTQYGDLTAMVI